MIFNMIGGGVGLNLKVVGGTVQPTGKENTIWVNTDTAITSYVFSATKPSSEEVTSSNVYTSSGASADTALIDYDETGEYEGWIVTKHIALPSNTKKLVCTFPYSNNDCFALYDSEKNFLTGVDYTAGTAEYSVPEGTAFIRISHRNDSTKPEIYAVYEQSNAVEGSVWFNLNISSPAAMNIDKKNTVMLYPTTCQQYIGGAWVNKDAQAYTNGAWIAILMALYAPGDKNTLTALAWAENSNKTAGTPTVVYADDYFTMTTDGDTGIVYYPEKIDLTYIKAIKADVTISGSLNSYAQANSEGLYIWDAVGTSYYVYCVAAHKPYATGDFELSIDTTDLSGEYYIGLGQGGGNGTTITVRKWWCEK